MNTYVNDFIRRFRKLPYEEKMMYTTRVSMGMNFLLAIGKIVFGLFYGFLFCISGMVNGFIFLSKHECFMGIKNTKRTFKTRNNRISIFLFVASIIYTLYMARLVFFDVKVYDYTMFIGVLIAVVSFTEMGVAIYGLIRTKRSGHYYRNIKIINFCSAMTAIVLTQVAIMSFTNANNSNMLNGLTGMGVGVVILLLSIFIYFAPMVSINDREFNIYELENEEKNTDIKITENKNIILSKSKIYGNYEFSYSFNGYLIEGYIIREKGIWSSLNIYLKIITIIFSEILIFPYAIGRLVYYFRTLTLIKDLDDKMFQQGFIKIDG